MSPATVVWHSSSGVGLEWCHWVSWLAAAVSRDLILKTALFVPSLNLIVINGSPLALASLRSAATLISIRMLQSSSILLDPAQLIMSPTSTPFWAPCPPGITSSTCRLPACRSSCLCHSPRMQSSRCHWQRAWCRRRSSCIWCRGSPYPH